jgi:hypothetical protein
MSSLVVVNKIRRIFPEGNIVGDDEKESDESHADDIAPH